MSADDIRRTLDTLRVTRAIDDAVARLGNAISIWFNLQFSVLLIVLARLEPSTTWQLIYVGAAGLALLGALCGFYLQWRRR